MHALPREMRRKQERTRGILRRSGHEYREILSSPLRRAVYFVCKGQRHDFLHGLQSEMRFLPELRSVAGGTRHADHARAACGYFRELEDAGADNVSLVTPSHLIGDIEKAFKIYRPKIPVVYNSGGYDDTESLKRIDDYIDIYLPDLKYVSPFLSERYTGRADYFSVASKAIKFMARKPLLFDEP